MDDEVLERNKNLNRGFRKLVVWREKMTSGWYNNIRGKQKKSANITGVY